MMLEGQDRRGGWIALAIWTLSQLACGGGRGSAAVECNARGGCPAGLVCVGGHVCLAPEAADGSGSGATAVDGGQPDGGPGGITVKGTIHQILSTASGIMDDPTDLSNVVVQARVYDPSTKMFSVSPGIGAANGTFAISGLPAGERYIQVAQDYIVTSEPEIDLGIVLTGRPNAAPARTSPTALDLRLSNLAPWVSGDALLVYTPNALSSLVFANLSGTVSPMLITSFDYGMLQGAALADAQQGDTTYILETTANTTPQTFYSIKRAFTSTSLIQQDGQTSSITGAFDDVAQDQSAHVTFCPSVFNRLKGNLIPTARNDDTWRVQVLVQPYGMDRGLDMTSQFVTLMTVPIAPSSQDVDLGNLSFGNPFPRSWGLFGLTSVTWKVDYALPNAAPLSFNVALVQGGTAAQLASLGCRPILSMPTNVQINGASALSPKSGIGETPTLSWSVPVYGAPTGYNVRVQELSKDVDQTTSKTVATLTTDATSVVIPPGILRPQHSYFFQIRAILGARAKLTSAPLLNKLPYGLADTTTAIFSP